MKKNSQILFVTNFSSINSTYNTHELLLNYLSKQFNKLFLVNAEKLLGNDKKKYFFSNQVLKRSKKTIIKNINLYEFYSLTSDKNNVVILNLNQDPKNFKIYRILNKKNFKLVSISNIGNFQKFALSDSNKNFFKTVNYLYTKYLFPKLLTILSNFGIVKKIDIKFISNTNLFKSIKKNYLKKILYSNKFLFIKKFIMINSKVSDLNHLDKKKVTSKYIIHLDQDLTYRHVTEITQFNSKQINLHYEFLNVFLKRISKILNKKVIVSIHPGYNKKLISKKLKDFKVIKYKTRELIKQSYLVTFFESSSILDAILLKKKVLALESKIIGNKSIYTNKLNIPSLNFFEKTKIKKIELIDLINRKNHQLEKYINDYHFSDKDNVIGIIKIVKEIKKIV